MVMMKDFNIDFVERSLKDLNKYSGDYEVTALVNYSLAFIILPKEVYYEELSDKYRGKKIKDMQEFNKFNLKGYFLLDGNMRRIDIKEIYVNVFLRKLRNGIAHFNIELLGDKNDPNKQIRKIIIEDKYNAKVNFSCEMSICDFKELATFVASQYLITYKSNNL